MINDQGFRFGIHSDAVEEERLPLLDAMLSAGGTRVDHADWDILWYEGRDPPGELYQNMAPGQRINHIPGIAELANKATLARNIEQYQIALDSRGTGDKTLPIHPLTFDLATQRQEAIDCFEKDKSRFWLLKPVLGSWGRDIRLISDVKDIPGNGQWLLQRYIDNPMLIDGAKFKVRRYLVITGIAPLDGWLYQDGLIDLATEPYSVDDKDLDNPLVHVANRGVQQQSNNYQSEIHRLVLSQHLDRHINPEFAIEMAQSAEQVLAHLLHAVSPRFTDIARDYPGSHGKCFELLGIDLMYDDTGKAWLLECNRSPSLSAGGTGPLKHQMLVNMLSLIRWQQHEGRSTESAINTEKYHFSRLPLI